MTIRRKVIPLQESPTSSSGLIRSILDPPTPRHAADRSTMAGTPRLEENATAPSRRADRPVSSTLAPWIPPQPPGAQIRIPPQPPAAEIRIQQQPLGAQISIPPQPPGAQRDLPPHPPRPSTRIPPQPTAAQTRIPPQPPGAQIRI